MEDSHKTDLELENLVMTEAAEEEVHSCDYDDKSKEPPVACSNVFYQTDLVSVPVKVKPFAKAGPSTIVCCGSPVITPGNACQGETDKICEFTITQKICVKLPLRFGATVSIDRAKVQCGGISETECECKNPCVRKCD